MPPVDTRAYGFWREGDLLAVRDGSTLAKRCIDTGVPTGVSPATVQVEWMPRWVLPLYLLPFVGLGVGRALRRRAELTVFATPRVHAQRQAGQRLGHAVQWVPALAFAVGIALALSGIGAGVLVMIAAIVLGSAFIGAGLWLIALNNLVKVQRITDGVAYVRVPPSFWAGLQTWHPNEHSVTTIRHRAIGFASEYASVPSSIS